jgi:hypothetical protein
MDKKKSIDDFLNECIEIQTKKTKLFDHEKIKQEPTSKEALRFLLHECAKHKCVNLVDVEDVNDINELLRLSIKDSAGNEIEIMPYVMSILIKAGLLD